MAKSDLEIGSRPVWSSMRAYKPVVLHELVVEIERHREPIGDGPRRKLQRSQHGHVGRLYPERVASHSKPISLRGVIST